MPDAVQLFPDIVRGQQLFHGTLHVQTGGVVAGVGFVGLGVHLTLDHELVIVQVPAVGGNPEILAHVLAAQTLLPGHQGLVELFAVAGADDIRARVAEKLLHGLGQISNGGGVCLLDEQIPGVGVGKGELHQIHGLVQIHEEPGHVGVCNGNGLACPNLVNEQGDDAAPGAHDVAVAGAADGGAAPFRGHPGVGVDDVLHHGLGNAHGVDGIGGLVRRQADHPLDPGIDGGVEHVVRALHVGLYRLHGEKFAGRHLLQRGGVEHIVNPIHGVLNGLGIPHIADVELDFGGGIGIGGLEQMTHIVLLLLIPGEDADLSDIRVQKMLQNGVAEGTGTAGNHQSRAGKF